MYGVFGSIIREKNRFFAPRRPDICVFTDIRIALRAFLAVVVYHFVLIAVLQIWHGGLGRFLSVLQPDIVI